MDIETALGIIGSTLGAFAFFWRIWESLMAHVEIGVEVFSPEETGAQRATALITIENNGKLPKKINYAVLVIGPEGENLSKVASRFLGKDGTKDDLDAMYAIYKARSITPAYSKDGKSAIIPLPYFFAEQRQLGNEKVRYRCSIETERLKASQYLTVRLIIFIYYKIGYLRWRTSSDLLVTDFRKPTI